MEEKNKSRRKREFQDSGYICCSTFGRARSKGFHCRYYKRLLAEKLPNLEEIEIMEFLPDAG